MKVLKVSEVASILLISTKTVLRRIKTKKIKAYKEGREYRITEESLKEYIENKEL